MVVLDRFQNELAELAWTFTRPRDAHPGKNTKNGF